MKIKAANDNDVKTGRGNHRHPGTIKCNKLISTYKTQFVMAHNDKAKRDTIIKNVYKHITTVGNPPGRFVEKHGDGSYTIKSKDFALQKIKKALSENSGKVKAYLELRGKLPPKDSIGSKKGYSTDKVKRGKLERIKSKKTIVLQEGSTLRVRTLIRQKSKTMITREDLFKLCSEISRIDKSKIKQIKRHHRRNNQILF